MDKYNYLDELPIASLDQEQLNMLQSVEDSINKNENEEIYLIAFKKNK